MTWGLGSHFNWLINKNILTNVWVSRKMSYLLISFYYFIKCLHHLLNSGTVDSAAVQKTLSEHFITLYLDLCQQKNADVQEPWTKLS